MEHSLKDKFFVAPALAIMPGLFLYLTDKTLSVVFRQVDIPLMCAITYSATFLLVGIVGILAFRLISMFTCEVKAFNILLIAGIVYNLVLACHAIYSMFFGHYPGFDFRSYHLVLLASMAMLTVTWFFARTDKLHDIRLYGTAGAFFLLVVAWGIVCPERFLLDRQFAGEAGIYLSSAFFIAVMVGLLYNLRLRASINIKPDLWAVVMIGVCIIIVHSLGGTFIKRTIRHGSPSGEMVRPDNSGTKPNIIFIVWDTVRKDHLSLYGYDRPTTPYLGKNAGHYEIYMRAVSVSPWTLASHASMFTGLYPRSHSATWIKGTGRDVLSKSYHDLPEQVVTLAEILSRKGYRCGGVSANFMFAGSINNMDQGFEFFDDERNPNSLRRHFWLHNYLVDMIQPLLSAGLRFKYFSLFLTAEMVNEKALEWLDSVGNEKPFLLFLNYMDAHNPYFPPPELVNRFPGFDRKTTNLLINPELGNPPLTESDTASLVSQYDAEIVYLDQQLQALEQGLRDRKLYDSAYVLLTSDHGEFFGEHNLLNHGNHLYEELLEVPLIIKHPASSKTGKVDKVIENRSLFYLVLEQAGIKLPGSGFPWSAVAELYPKKDEAVINTEGKTIRKPLHVMRAVYFDDFKFISTSLGAGELYNTKVDPHETTNLDAKDPENAGRARNLLEEFQKLIPDGMDLEKTGSGKLNPDQFELLKSLGYIQ